MTRFGYHTQQVFREALRRRCFVWCRTVDCFYFYFIRRSTHGLFCYPWATCLSRFCGGGGGLEALGFPGEGAPDEPADRARWAVPVRSGGRNPLQVRRSQGEVTGHHCGVQTARGALLSRCDSITLKRWATKMHEGARKQPSKTICSLVFLEDVPWTLINWEKCPFPLVSVGKANCRKGSLLSYFRVWGTTNTFPSWLQRKLILFKFLNL